MKKFFIISLSLLLCFQASATVFLTEEGNKHEQLNCKIEMKKYKVIALSVGAQSNRIFSVGDEVSEDAWEEGKADELVKKGFLKELDADNDADEINPQEPNNFEDVGGQNIDTTIPDESIPLTPDQINTDNPTEINVDSEPNPQVDAKQDEAIQIGDQATDQVVDTTTAANEIQSIPDIDKITKGEIIKNLKEKGVDYDVNSTKQELYSLLYNKN